MQDRGARRARRRLRPAGPRADRPRRHERRGRALQGGAASTASSRSSAARSTSSTTTPGARTARRPNGRVERNHLTLLAASDAGYRNLVKLSSAGFLEGLHRGKPNARHGPARRPRRGHHRADRLPGLALLPAPRRRPRRRGPRARRRPAAGLRRRQRLLRGPEERHRRAGQGQRGHRPDRPRGRPPARRHRRRPLPAPRGLPPPHGAAVRADEVDARRAEDDASTRTSSSCAPTRRWRARSPSGPRRSPSTLEIAERCDVEIELGKQLIPRYLPEGEDEGAYLRARVREGLRARYGDPPPAEALERMEMELGVIDRMGFNAYFLIVWDFVKWAKDNGIAVGPGRGSAAGSLVAYCLRITDVDPLRYDLLFERFLNPERVSMPDIDIDFSVRGRERVMRYVDRQVRARVGRADRHLRQDVPARGHARRRARARPRLRRRRPPGQADPRPEHGPPAELRGLPQAGRAAARRRTTATRRPSRSSTSRRASRGSSATRRSTPPRS